MCRRSQEVLSTSRVSIALENDQRASKASSPPYPKPPLTPPTMPSLHLRPRQLALLLCLCIALASVYAEKSVHHASIASMSIPELEDKLQVPLPTPNYLSPTISNCMI